MSAEHSLPETLNPDLEKKYKDCVIGLTKNPLLEYFQTTYQENVRRFGTFESCARLDYPNDPIAPFAAAWDFVVCKSRFPQPDEDLKLRAADLFEQKDVLATPVDQDFQSHVRQGALRSGANQNLQTLLYACQRDANPSNSLERRLTNGMILYTLDVGYQLGS